MFTAIWRKLTGGCKKPSSKTMKITKCAYCGKENMTHECQIKRNLHHFCNKEHHLLWKKSLNKSKGLIIKEPQNDKALLGFFNLVTISLEQAFMAKRKGKPSEAWDEKLVSLYCDCSDNFEKDKLLTKYYL